MKQDEILQSMETLFQAVSHLISITEKLEKEIEELKQSKTAPLPDWMTIEQLMEYLPTKPGRRIIYDWVRAKKIPSHKLQGSLIFNRQEVDEWVIKGSPEEMPPP